MADTSASGSSLGRSSRQPQQTICSASFCPSLAACLNISYSMTSQCGLSSSHLVCPSKNNSTSIILLVCWTDPPSQAAHPLVATAFPLLLLYFLPLFCGIYRKKRNRIHKQGRMTMKGFGQMLCEANHWHNF